VVLRVRQPNSNEVRTITATRGLLPRQTIQGIRKFAGGGGETLIRGTDRVAYLKFEEITGSTRQELRALAQVVEAEGARAVILDLRPASSADLHPTVLLADALLEGGTIGRVRSGTRVETFEAEPDALFRGLPLAVLVDNASPSTVQWLAAALQDNHRAAIVGGSAHGPHPKVYPRVIRRDGAAASMAPVDLALVWTAVPVGDGAWSIEMPTGRLERGDGRPLSPRWSRLPIASRFVRPDPKKPDLDAPAGRLVPDILVDKAASAETPRLEAGEEPEVDPNVRGDAILTAAVRRLREALKSP
jgi:carboxyl-terminal processing protease